MSLQMHDPLTGDSVSVSLMPSDMSKLWYFRLDCKSQSGKHYIISLAKHQKRWACSCPGYCRRKIRECKHLRALGLQNKLDPPEPILNVISPMRWFAIKALLETTDV